MRPHRTRLRPIAATAAISPFTALGPAWPAEPPPRVLGRHGRRVVRRLAGQLSPAAASPAAPASSAAATFDNLEPSDGAVGIRDTTATFTIDVQ
jgi:hypothetical protein